MARIMTVCGPLAPTELGFTSMHDHTLLEARFMRKRYEMFIPPDAPVKANEPLSLSNLGILKHGFILSNDLLEMKDETLMSAELSDYRDLGGSALVDMSTPGLRVDPLAYRRISENSGIHIVATTGFYSSDSWPERFHAMSIPDMEDYMLDEIQNGMEGTDVMPGHIKIAIEEKFSEAEVSALRAGARTAEKTGLSMTVHQGMLLEREDGIRIVDIVEEEGLALDRLVLAHNDTKCFNRNIRDLILDPQSRNPDFSTALELLERGANLSIDCFGHYWDSEPIGFTHVLDWQRIVTLLELIRAGFEEQLVVGTDSFIKLLLKRFGGEGYGRLLNFTVPMLREVGVRESAIEKITVDNPARILSVDSEL